MRISVIESVLRRSIEIPLLLLGAVTLGCSQGSWTQWGGPNRDFSVGAAPIAEKWPEGGPQKLWSRELGDGFSTIVSDGRTLFAMYRGEQDQECIAALDASTGKTIWEHKYAAPFIEFEVDEIDKETGKKRIEKQVTKFGTGPNSTPLLVGGRLFTLGYTGIFSCLDAATGKVNWSHDLYKDMGATYLRFGWATSPLAYGDNVIVLTGGKGHGVTSFKQATGEVAWQSSDLDASYSSPILVNVGGRDHLVAYMSNEIIGMDPKTGEQHWNLEHKNEYGTSIATPLWCPDNLLYFVNGGDEAGGRVVRLAAKDDKIVPEEVWVNRKIRGGLSNPVRIGDYLYGPNSAGENAKLIVGFDLRTGEVAWQDRAAPGPKCINADGRLIVLDDDGNLLLIAANPEGMSVLSQTKLLESPSWTAPTLVGSKLYLRDRKVIMALDLS